eukprot:4378-Heterococcus_DN1.PRE.2
MTCAAFNQCTASASACISVYITLLIACQRLLCCASSEHIANIDHAALSEDCRPTKGANCTTQHGCQESVPPVQ